MTFDDSNSFGKAGIWFKRMLTSHPALAASMMIVAISASAGAEQRQIDTSQSVLTVRVQKAGALSVFGHDHEIGARIASGSVDTSAQKVELSVKTGALKVKDPGASEKDRAEIQKTMLGPEVLDADQHPEIVFHSTSAERLDSGAWKVTGSLTLHGQTRTVVVEVKAENERFVGTARLRQTDFGMKPVKVAGGTIRVKDEVRIEFDVRLAR